MVFENNLGDEGQRLRRAAELAGIGFCSIDFETGQYLACDAQYAAMIGETVKSMTQMNVVQDVILGRMHPDDRDGAFRVRERVIKGEKADGMFRVSHADGSYRVIRQIFEPDETNTEDATIVHAVAQDQTELYALQDSLLQSQKLDAIGKLTGGVAHDFNNILATIIGNLELIRDFIVPGAVEGDQLELLQAAIDASFRGADLTKKLLSFARKAQLSPRSMDLNTAVSRARTWIGRTIPANIEIETSLLAGLWPIHADEAALQNALLNLIINARDAMPAGGKLTLETSNVRIDDDYLRTRGEDIPTGRYVLLAVSDTGTGIDDETIDRVFEPFFTTKPVGTGSGLGLATVQGFVKQSRGTIQVYSEPGHGTTFKLYFPITGEAVVADKQNNVKTSAPRGSATVFLVEDEVSVREMLKKSLRGAGYTVVTASSGDEAAQLYEQIGVIDLLLTDIVMPGRLQGTDLAKELRARTPDLPAIFLSGYAAEATVHGNGLKPDDIRLMKPVARGDLLLAVRKAIENKSKRPG